MYEILEKNGVDVPNHVVLERRGDPEDGERGMEGRRGKTQMFSLDHPSPPPTLSLSLSPEEELVENDDTIEVRGQVFHKPFVEKPVSAEDHHIYIYFPSDYGGGCQRLFRKVGVAAEY